MVLFANLRLVKEAEGRARLAGILWRCADGIRSAHCSGRHVAHWLNGPEAAGDLNSGDSPVVTGRGPRRCPGLSKVYI